MTVKERGNRVYVYGDEAAGEDGKRGKALGVLRGPDYAVDDALKAQLSAEDLAEVEAAAARRRRSATVQRDHAVATLGETLEQVLAWAKTAEKDAVKALSAEVHGPLTRLRRHLSAGADGRKRKGAADEAGDA